MERLFLEEGEAENLQDRMQGRLHVEPLPDDGYEDVDGDCNPHLSLHGVLRGTEECFDSQMLLDPFEEQFDLPATATERRDVCGAEIEMVGEKYEELVIRRIVELHAA